MPLVRRIPDTTSSALFGGAPSQTNAPSQGSITFFQDVRCNSPLSDTATPLILGECLNVPIPGGILAVSIDSVPACPNYGTPLLIVTDQPDCKKSTEGTDPDSGELDKCQAYTTSADIGSVEFICYGNGIAPVEPTTTSSEGYTATDPPTAESTPAEQPPENNSSNGGDGDSCCDCCCCCVVM
jgi:hypothetical protein